MAREQYESSNGRDLYLRVRCTCPHGTPKLADLGVSHTLWLTGYADDNFFHNVNREPRKGACKCGRAYSVQWFEDGVEFAFDDIQDEAR